MRLMTKNITRQRRWAIILRKLENLVSVESRDEKMQKYDDCCKRKTRKHNFELFKNARGQT